MTESKLKNIVSIALGSFGIFCEKSNLTEEFFSLGKTASEALAGLASITSNIAANKIGTWITKQLSPELEQVLERTFDSTIESVAIKTRNHYNIHETFWNRLKKSFNKKENKTESAYETLLIDFFKPILDDIIDDKTQESLLKETSPQLYPEKFIQSIIEKFALKEKNKPLLTLINPDDPNEVIQFIVQEFKISFLENFREQLVKNDRARNSYFMIVFEQLLRSNHNSVSLIKNNVTTVLTYIDKLDVNQTKGFIELERLIVEREKTILKHFDSTLKQVLFDLKLDTKDESDQIKSENNHFYFGTQYTHFVGRKKEMQVLHDFLDTDNTFEWLLITGPAGSGKSRVALELCRLGRNLGIACGFYSQDTNFNWDKWEPVCKTLIILDYALYNIERTSSIIAAIYRNRSRLSNKNKVRLILIDRKNNTDWEETVLGNTWRNTSFFSNPKKTLELPSVHNEFLWQIIKQVISDNEYSELNKEEKYHLLNNSKNDILQDLNRIDKHNRPLFAFFAAKALCHKKELRNWNSNDLLDFHYSRIREKTWKKVDSFNEYKLELEKVLALNTFCRKLDQSQIFKLLKKNNVFQNLNKVITDYELLTENTNEEKFGEVIKYYHGLEPDVLGEYHIIKTYKKVLSLEGQNSAKKFLLNAFKINPEKVCEIGLLCWLDFYELDKDFFHAHDFVESLNSISKKKSFNLIERKWIAYALSYRASIFLDQGKSSYAMHEYEASSELFLPDAFQLNSWAVSITKTARTRNDKLLFEKAFELYERSIELDPKNSFVYMNYGTDLGMLARLENNDELLYNKAFEMYLKSAKINNTADLFYNWSIDLKELAKSKNYDPTLLQEAIDKAEIAVDLAPSNDFFHTCYGKVIATKAKSTNNIELFDLAFKRFEKSSIINPKNDNTFNEWGCAIGDLAKLQNLDKELVYLAIEKFEKATEINHINHHAYLNWANHLFLLANKENDASLFRESFIIFRHAANSHLTFQHTYSSWLWALKEYITVESNYELIIDAIDSFCLLYYVVGAPAQNWRDLLVYFILEKSPENKLIEMAFSTFLRFDSTKKLNLLLETRIASLLGAFYKDNNYDERLVCIIDKWFYMACNNNDCSYEDYLVWIAFLTLKFESNKSNNFEDLQKSISLIEETNRKFPNNSEIYYHWGTLIRFLTHNQKDDTDLLKKSCELFEKCIELDPKNDKAYFEISRNLTHLAYNEKGFINLDILLESFYSTIGACKSNPSNIDYFKFVAICINEINRYQPIDVDSLVQSLNFDNSEEYSEESTYEYLIKYILFRIGKPEMDLSIAYSMSIAFDEQLTSEVKSFLDTITNP